MLRGQQSIVKVFPVSVIDKPENKGQKSVHISRRDEVLTARFYYYYHLKRMRYDDILLELEKEFFITPNVVVQRLSLTGDLAKQLVRDEATTTELKRQYPLFVWA